MIVPQYMRFYGYTLDQTLEEFAISFFALVNYMYRIVAQEMLNDITTNAIPQMDSKNAGKITKDLQRSARGVQGILDEVRIIKK